MSSATTVQKFMLNRCSSSCVLYNFVFVKTKFARTLTSSVLRACKTCLRRARVAWIFCSPSLAKFLDPSSRIGVLANHRCGRHGVVTHKILLDFCATPPRAVALRPAPKQKTAFKQFFVLVPPAGIEPASRTPQARVLSIERRGRH